MPMRDSQVPPSDEVKKHAVAHVFPPDKTHRHNLQTATRRTEFVDGLPPFLATRRPVSLTRVEGTAEEVGKANCAGTGGEAGKREVCLERKKNQFY